MESARPNAESSANCRSGWHRIVVLFLAMLGFASGAALVLGFMMFVRAVEGIEPPSDVRAGGIVALTGGAERIAEAVDLLAAGRADRLLITGVNQSTNASEIARLTPHYRSLFSCCIDLGYQATNTIGNAAEIGAWARAHGMKSLIVVTSYYHMPRALMEIGNALPGTVLFPYPVALDRIRSATGWGSTNRLRVLVFEYGKYLAALLRTRLMRTPPQPAALADSARGT